MNADEAIRVLLIDDSKTDGRLIEIMLSESNHDRFELSQVYDLASGLLQLDTLNYDIILLDLGLPDSQGLETVRRTTEHVAGIPIIILTGLDDEELAMKAVKEHVQDYLVKDKINGSLLEHTIYYAIARKRTEEELRESREEWKSMFLAISDSALILSPEHEILYANPASERTSGLNLDELKGRKCYKIFHDSSRPPDECPLTALLKSEQPQTMEMEVEMEVASGSFLVTVAPLFDQQGRLSRVIHIGKDITKNKRAELELRMSENKYRSLFEESKDVLFISNPGGSFTDINAAGVELFGFRSREELLQAVTAKDLFEDPQEWENLSLDLKDRGFVKDHEIYMISQDGKKLTVLATATVESDDSGNITAFRGILHDMTEHRILEQQLLRAQRMESIGRLAGGVAHDFNNFLTAVEGYIDMAMMELDENDSAYSDLVEAQRSAERAANLTRQLLLFSRRETMDFKPVDLNRVVSDLLKMLSQLLGEKYELLVNTERDLWQVRADVGHIEQVLMNLCVNARDAMPDGGTITISTGNAHISEKYAEMHTGAGAGDFVRLSVTDTGIGMDMETISHIFEPFFSTKQAGEGTGLGLSVVYGIVNQHGGWIEANSTPGAGSTFDIYLPVISSDAEDVSVDASAPEKLDAAGEKVLLVEDDEAIRRLTLKILEKAGYRVSCAGNSHEALALCQKEGDGFQLVFSDVVLPGGDGISLVEKILVDNPDTGVLLTSGYNEEANWQKINARGYRFLQKPYSSYDLLKSLRQLLDEDSSRREDTTRE